MADINWDEIGAGDVKLTEKTGFDPWPKGSKIRCKVEKAAHDSRPGKGRCFAVGFSAVEGEFAGQWCWMNAWTERNANPETDQITTQIGLRKIRALYEASRNGVDIDLTVRGICCLRPGIPGVSDRIRVRSIVGRYLEHSRIYYFENGDEAPDILIGSADWMPRNFFRRVEAIFPIENPLMKARLKETLDLYLRDNEFAKTLRPNGSYVSLPVRKGKVPFSVQRRLAEIASSPEKRT